MQIGRKGKNWIKVAINNAYIFSVIAKVLSIFTGLVFSVLYSRYMQPSLRGTASVISNYAELIMLVLCFGIYQGYPYFKRRTGRAIYADFINLIAGMFIAYLAIGSVLIIALQPNISVAVTIALIPLMFATKQLNYVVLIENPKLRNSTQIWLDLFDIFFVLILMAFTKANFLICMIFLYVKEFVYFFIAVANLRFNIFKIRPSLKEMMPYIRFGFVPMLTVIMMEINYKADVLMLEYFDIDKAQIGIYALGVSLAQKVWLIPDAMKDILLSNLAKGKGEREVAKITRMSFMIMLFFVAALLLLGKPVVDWLYGIEYEGTYSIILILIVGIMGMVFYKMIYSYNVIYGYKNINLLFLSIAAGANVIINALVIPVWGIYGAGAASTLSYIICGGAFLVYFCKKTHTSFKAMLFIQQNDIELLKQLINK